MRGLLVVCLAVSSFVLQGCGGCGDDNNGRLPDAPPLIDASIDAMIPPVTLTVTRLGEPNAAVRVYFLAPDDTLIKMADTDANGVASALMPVGGSVTAINPFEQPPLPARAPNGKVSTDDLKTFLGVKPGDHLVLSQPLFDSISFVVNVSAVEGASSYELITTCGTSSVDTSGGSGAQVFFENCHGGADVALRVSSQNEGGIDYISGLYHPDATLTNNEPLDLTEDTYQSLTNVNVTYMNAPAGVIDVFHGPIAKHGVIGPFMVSTNGGEATIPEPTLTGVTKAIFGSSLVVNSQHDVVDWGDFTTNYTLDFNNLLLREITSTTEFDPAMGKLTWTEADVGVVPDLSVGGVQFRRSDETMVRRWHWELAQAHSTTEIKLPKLPTDLFDWTPTADDQIIFIDPVTNYKLPGGYDAARPHIFDIHDVGSPATVVTGNSGRAQRVQFRPPPEGPGEIVRRPFLGARAAQR